MRHLNHVRTANTVKITAANARPNSPKSLWYERLANRWWTLGLGSLAAATLIVLSLAGCGLTKQEVKAGLLALEKNQPIQRASLKTLALPLDFGDGVKSYQVPYLHHVPKSRRDGAPPLLLIHGTPSTLFTWVHAIYGGTTVDGSSFPGLGDDFEILAPDLLGHGAAKPESRPVTFDKLVTFAAAFLAELGIQRAVVIGHSYGGEVAWRLAHKHPKLVEKLVLLDASGYHRPRWEVPEEELILKEHWLARFGGLATARADVKEALEISFVHGVPEDEVDENHLLVKNDDNWQTMIDLAKEEEGYAEATIGSLRQATLILWGEQDGNFPVQLHPHRFDHDILNSTLILIPDCGHYPQVEQPEAVVRHVADFLQQGSSLE